ncbi:glutathione S-transferase family protein [Halomonas denitrificans]|nr:glutathione S-transferase family protein [Halomonas denitrificans]
MKLYSDERAPSPRRVHLFLEARGIELPVETVDLASGGQLEAGFLEINPDGTVPVLELDDGTRISEVVAICRYLDEISEGVPLYGRTPLERARILDTDHWLEMQGLLAVMEGFRNGAPGMKDRGLPGPTPVAQLPELAERGRQRVERFFDRLDTRLETGADSGAWIAGGPFSGADITAWVILEFAGWGLKLQPQPRHRTLLEWRARAAERLGVG